jgi:osmoprotectant transport system permease protein
MKTFRGRLPGISPEDIVDAVAAGLRATADYEFWSRGEWTDVRRLYGLDFAEERAMDPSLLYQAVASGQVDVVTVSLSGRPDRAP